VQDSHGSKFHSDLNIAESDVVVKKGLLERVDSYSGFGSSPEDTGLNSLMQEEQITTVYVVGLAFDYCVGSTARDAAKNGYETYIVAEATKHIAEDTQAAMKKLLDDLNVQTVSITRLSI